jgi:hypothetical protein
MAIALSLCGFFLWMDKGYTPVAVVSCVIVYNAAFGFSWVSRLYASPPPDESWY